VDPTNTATAIGSPSPTGSVDSPSPTRSVEVLEAAVPADWVRAGRQTTVRTTIRNPGDRRSVDLQVTHDGQAVASQTVTLRANTTEVYEVRVEFSEPRDGTVAVAGVAAGDLTVAPPSEPSPSGASRTAEDGGTGAASGLFVALLAATLVGLARRRGRL
jgi:hypothetical protein